MNNNATVPNNYGTKPALIIVIIILVLIIFAIILQSVYKTPTSQFGTWSPIISTTCLNNGQSCTIKGTATQYQVCTPNPTTGFGCLDDNGNQTFLNKSTTISCNPTCYLALWSNITSTPCQVYTDETATTLAPNQTCVNNNPETFSFSKTSRTCTPFDVTGTNACIKLDGSVAPIGFTELTNVQCSEIPPCYTGTWLPCTANSETGNCSMVAANCGRVVTTTESKQCQAIVNGVPTIVDPSNCNPLDQGSACTIGCFNLPCGTWPAGYSNITALQGMYIEFKNTITGNTLQADYASNTFNLINNPIATVSGSNIVTVTTAAPHGYANGDFVLIRNLIGVSINGIPLNQINDNYKPISSVTATTFKLTVVSNATSTGNAGGNAGIVIQGQLAAALAQTDVLATFGDVNTVFATSSQLTTIRWQLLPSLSRTADSVLYLVAYLPYNGQIGLGYWNGSMIKITSFPALLPGESLDDVSPALGDQYFFSLTGASAPYKLNNVTYPGPILVSLFCGVPPCIGFDIKTCPLYDPPTCN